MESFFEAFRFFWKKIPLVSINWSIVGDCQKCIDHRCRFDEYLREVISQARFVLCVNLFSLLVKDFSQMLSSFFSIYRKEFLCSKEIAMNQLFSEIPLCLHLKSLKLKRAKKHQEANTNKIKSACIHILYMTNFFWTWEFTKQCTR